MFPAAGGRNLNSGNPESEGRLGWYGTSTTDGDYNHFFLFEEGSISIGNAGRMSGTCIRCVKEIP
jgi:hypothetical protein